MPSVELTPNLYRFFPSLEGRPIRVEGGTVAEVISAVEEIAPGFSHYIIDDQGALRRHINLSVGDRVVVDKKHLADCVKESDTVFIFQALSGG